MVFNQLVGLHGVGADLAAKADFGFRGVEFIEGFAALFEFEFVELGAQDFHGDFAILVLAAFVLTLDHGVGRQVGDADRGFHFVDVLPAVAAGAEGVNAQVVGLDVDFDAVVNFGNDEGGRKGSVAARGLVEWRDTHKAMHSAFTGQHAVGVFAFDLHGGGFYSGFFTGRGIENRGPENFLFRPPQGPEQ